MRKVLPFSVLTCTIILSGCFSFGSSNTEPAATDQTSSDQVKQYQNSEFSLMYPADWEVLTTNDFTSDLPPETQLVVRNNLKNEIFTANINVVRNNVPANTATLDYAKEVLNREKSGLLDFKETKRELTKITIAGTAVETYTVNFEARLTQSDPLTRFIQTFGVKGQNGYIILGASSLQENSSVVNKVSDTVKSFKLN